MVCSVECCDGTSIPLSLLFVSDYWMIIKSVHQMGNAIPSAHGTEHTVYQLYRECWTFTLARLCPSVDSAHLSPGQKKWVTLEWSGYHFALEVCNQTEGLSQLVHCSPLYNGVWLSSLAHPSRLGNAVDMFYTAWVDRVLRNSIFPLNWTTHPHDVSGNGPCLPK